MDDPKSFSEDERKEILKKSWPGNGLPPKNIFCFGWIPSATLKKDRIEGVVQEWKWINFDEADSSLRKLCDPQASRSPRSFFHTLQLKRHENWYAESGVFVLTKYSQKISSLRKALGFPEPNYSLNITPYEYNREDIFAFDHNMTPPENVREVIFAFDHKAALPFAIQRIKENTDYIEYVYSEKTYFDSLAKLIESTTKALSKFTEKTSPMLPEFNEIGKLFSPLVYEHESKLPETFLPKIGNSRLWKGRDVMWGTPLKSVFSNSILDNPKISTALDLVVGVKSVQCECLGDDLILGMENKRNVQMTLKQFMNAAIRFHEELHNLGKLNVGQGGSNKEYRKYILLELSNIFEAFSGWWKDGPLAEKYGSTMKDFIRDCLSIAGETVEVDAVAKQMSQLDDLAPHSNIESERLEIVNRSFKPNHLSKKDKSSK